MPEDPKEPQQPANPTPASDASFTASEPPVASAPTPPSSPAVAPLEKKRRTKKIIIIITSILGGLILLCAGVIGGAVAVKYLAPNALPSLSTGVDGNTTITAEESSIAAVAERVGPSVVSIVTETRMTSYYGTTSGQAAGTGVIISDSGYVLTNNHVLEGSNKVSVVDSNGELYEDVTVVGRDPLNDIAFLKIQSDTTFTAASLGNSATIRTGQQVIAIGNALGQYSNTVTSGIISGTGRPITASSSGGATETLTDLIQTDASINPGNSGGPLVNMAGQVIGINTAIVEDANGIGFAIPINATKGVIAEVLETGEVTRSYLGVNYLTVTPDVAREYDLSVNAGAYIFSESSNPIGAGSPAEEAGLKSGDIITKVNGETVGEQGSLSSILGEYRPEDKVTITYLRDGNEQTASVILGAYSE